MAQFYHKITKNKISKHITDKPSVIRPGVILFFRRNQNVSISYL
jgi:hypothetical protein